MAGENTQLRLCTLYVLYRAAADAHATYGCRSPLKLSLLLTVAVVAVVACFACFALLCFVCE